MARVIQIYLNAEELEKLEGLANEAGATDIKKYAKEILLSYKNKQEKKEFASLVYKATLKALTDFSAE